ncbi:MAG: chorismate synthase [Clostridiales bacterium]|nr:chorismate synthase [Clostridiales bacterium]MDY4894973.1 chorismate synthase [Christensenellaceae bacterium]
MKNTFGQSVTLTVFGESHGTCVGAVIDGLAPGIPINETEMQKALALRRPSSAFETARKEQDEFFIVSGVFNGRTTGTPLTILIENGDIQSENYEKARGIARPSHADYAAYCKYHGFEDYRGGGHFSGRVTAAIVAAGAIFSAALSKSDITVGSHILRLGGISDRPFPVDPAADITRLAEDPFPVLVADKKNTMLKAIEAAANNGDSVGGVTETAVCGIPAGLGEPWFDSVESVLSHALFSVGGIKGVSFGDGFTLAEMRGSEANDSFRIAGNGGIVTVTNHGGGINGGITNGMPIVFSCAVKPAASIHIEQNTVNFLNGTNEKITVNGRHDPCIVRRAVPVINAITAFVVCDLLALRFGTDVLAEGISDKAK